MSTVMKIRLGIALTFFFGVIAYKLYTLDDKYKVPVETNVPKESTNAKIDRINAEMLACFDKGDYRQAENCRRTLKGISRKRVGPLVAAYEAKVAEKVSGLRGKLDGFGPVYMELITLHRLTRVPSPNELRDALKQASIKNQDKLLVVDFRASSVREPGREEELQEAILAKYQDAKLPYLLAFEDYLYDPHMLNPWKEIDVDIRETWPKEEGTMGKVELEFESSSKGGKAAGNWDKLTLSAELPHVDRVNHQARETALFNAIKSALKKLPSYKKM